MRIGTRVIIKPQRKGTKDWTCEYNNLKGKIIERRKSDPYGNNRLLCVKYEKFVGTPRNGGFTGWFKESELLKGGE